MIGARLGRYDSRHQLLLPRLNRISFKHLCDFNSQSSLGNGTCPSGISGQNSFSTFEIDMIRSVVVAALLCVAPSHAPAEQGRASHYVMEMDFTVARQQVVSGLMHLP